MKRELGFRLCVRTGKETADLSTPLRSGRDDKFVARFETIFHGKGVIAYPQICHLDRSVAEWRDLRFLLSSDKRPMMDGELV
jgi:hypothetical protein